MVRIAISTPEGGTVPVSSVTIRSFWNRVQGKSGGDISYARISDALKNRPPASNYLICTVYDSDATNRFIGHSIFPVDEMATGSPVTSPIFRAGRNIHPVLTFGEYDPPHISNSLIGTEADAIIKSSHSIRYDVVDAHQEHYVQNPQVTRPDYTYYKWPIWPNGMLPLPGWKFAHTKATKPSSLAYYEQALKIATQRENIGSDPEGWSTDDLGVAAVGTISAHPTSTLYRKEADPLIPNAPSESFRAMRLSGRGDCEDVSWEMCNSKREIAKLPEGGMSKGLRAVKRHLDNYTDFMTLVSATVGDADSVGNARASSERQAHMLTLLIPNNDLAKMGQPVQPQTTLKLPVLIGEGTGRVFPNHTGRTSPKGMTERGRKWQNEMVTHHKTKGIKRQIYSPTRAGSQIVADFYDDIITGYNPETGLLDFRDSENNLGYSMAKLIDGNTSDARLVSVPGTKPEHESESDASLIKIISGFSEPIMDLDHTPEAAVIPVSAAVLFARKTFPEAGPQSVRDATLVLPFQAIDTTDEMSFLAFLKRSENAIAEVGIIPQPISTTGGYQFNITLK